MDTETLSHYLSVYHCPSISTPVFSRLLQEFGTLDRIRSLPNERLVKLGFESTQIAALKAANQSSQVRRSVEQDLSWAAASENSIVGYESSEYPPLLKEIQCAPPLLYVIGQTSKLSTPQLAMVGSRKASNYGRRNAYWMANELSQAGLTICSGMASGIDSEAHRGALEAACPTVAVMGTGADKIYPACNRKLAEQIKLHGAIVSEFPLGTPPLPHNFPRRNRIISGMSLGTLVVEATRKSGSLITARLAMEQNREVFAFPGPITSQSSWGCHRLIKDGAKLVEEPADITEEISMYCPDARPDTESKCQQEGLLAGERQELDPVQQQILDIVGDQGCVMQALLQETGLEFQVLNMQLLELELQGRIIAEASRYFRVN